MTEQEFCELVKYHRLRLRITQTELSKRSAVSQSMISKIEAGKMDDPCLSIARRLAKVCGFSLDAVEVSDVIK